MLHRNYGFNARRTLLLGAAFACAWAPSVHAQSQQSGQPAAGQNEGLQDIIVTAQKREESNSKVGLSIVAMSGDALDQRNIAGADDLARVVPGFTFANSAFNAPVYSIRGVGFNDGRSEEHKYELQSLMRRSY